jgi:hypothetical protein
VDRVLRQAVVQIDEQRKNMLFIGTLIKWRVWHSIRKRDSSHSIAHKFCHDIVERNAVGRIFVMRIYVL